MSNALRKVLIVLLWIILLGGGFVFLWIDDASLSPPAIDAGIKPHDGAR